MTPLPSKSIKTNPNGTYTATWYINRKRRQETFSSYRLAEDFLIKKRLEAEKDDVYGRTNKVEIEGLIKSYRREVKKALNSIKRDDLIFPRWINWLRANRLKYVSQLQKWNIQEYELHRAKDDVGQRTINIDIKTFDAALNHAWKHGRITFNPIARYPYKKDRKPFERYLTASEIEQILTTAKEYVMYPHIYALLTLGLRTSEICYLQYGDVRDNIIHLRKKRISAPHAPEEWEPKWGKERWISLDSDYANDQYLMDRCVAKRSKREFVFPDPRYEGHPPFNRDAFYRVTKQILRDSKIENYQEITTHTLRHTHISYAVARVGIDRNITLRIIMDNVGIRDYQTLMRYSQAVKNLSKNLPDPERFPWQNNKSRRINA